MIENKNEMLEKVIKGRFELRTWYMPGKCDYHYTIEYFVQGDVSTLYHPLDTWTKLVINLHLARN